MLELESVKATRQKGEDLIEGYKIYRQRAEEIYKKEQQDNK